MRRKFDQTGITFINKCFVLQKEKSDRNMEECGGVSSTLEKRYYTTKDKYLKFLRN
jgi:hypothetical protein